MDAATMSNMDHQFDDPVAGRSRRVGAHPAFPSIAAAWFAALFGFGCMLLPGAMVDGSAGALNLGAISDNFVGPVDFVGRSILAVIAGVLGGVGGWAAARRIAAMQGRAMAPGPRTLDISELDGESPIGKGGQQEAPRRKRRTLAIADGDARSAYPNCAIRPAPAQAERRTFDPPPVPAVGVDSDLPDSFAAMDRHPISEAPESADFARREEPAMAQAPEPMIGKGDELAVPHAAEMQDMVDIGGWNEEEAQAAPPAEETPDAAEAPIAFSAPSLSRASRCEPPVPARDGANRNEQFLGQIANADLESLGTVQLAERLAISIVRRRERIAAQAVQPVPMQPFRVPPPVPDHADHSATATAFESAPEALRPIRFDFSAEEAEEEDLGLSLPLDAIRHSPGSPLAVRQPRSSLFDGDEDEVGTSFLEPDFEEEEEGEDLGENYGSLLATRRDLDPGGGHVRIEEPEPDAHDVEPAVIFPGQPRCSEAPSEALPPEKIPPHSLRPFDPPVEPTEGEKAAGNAAAAPDSLDRAEAERSLRKALEALQRSGDAG